MLFKESISWSVWYSQLHKSYSFWSIQMFRLFWLIKVPKMSSGFLYLILQKKWYFKNLSIRIRKYRQAWEHFFPNFTEKSCEVSDVVKRAAITGTYQLIRQTRLNVDGYCDFLIDKKKIESICSNIVGFRDILQQSRHIVGIFITLRNFTIILTAFLLLTQRIYR